MIIKNKILKKKITRGLTLKRELKVIMATLDTHAIVKELIAAGTPEKQAEVFVERFMLRNEIHDLEHRLATKSDISELRIDISSMNTNIKWLMAIVLVVVGILLKNTFIV